MAIAVATAPGKQQSLSDVHLGRLLQDRGLINEHQLVDALRAQAASGGRLGTILVRRGCLTDGQLEAALRTQDELRRAGVVLDLAVVAGGATARSVVLALTVNVPPAGSQGGLPHHGIAARQHIVLPTRWLPARVLASGPTSDGSFQLTATDGRLVDYRIGLSLKASEESLPLVPGRAVKCPLGEPFEESLCEITVLVDLPADSLRDGGAGRFIGRFELSFRDND